MPDLARTTEILLRVREGEADGADELLPHVCGELATGDNPFAGDRLATVMRRVLDVAPPRLGDACPQVSACFEEVVHTLLAKDPDDRLPSDEALCDVLAAGEESAWWRARSADLRARSRGRLRRARVPHEAALQGREEQLASLEAAYDAACRAEGAVVHVEGEPGIGKTRPVEELVARVERRDEPPEVLIGGYAPLLASGCPGAVLAALRAQLGTEDVEERLSDLLPAAPALVAAALGAARISTPRGSGCVTCATTRPRSTASR